MSDLDEVAAKIAELVSSDPARAVTLYETFLAACYVKIEELNDSSGRFGQFVDELYCGWIEMDAVKVFNKANLAAFLKQVRARFDAAAQKTAKKDDKLQERPDYIRRRRGEVLRTLYAAQNDVAAYVAFAEETDLKATDCHASATLLVSKRKPKEALSWVERGFEVDKKTPHGSTASHDLAELMRRTKDVDLEDLSRHATEPAAKKFEKPHPDLAARLWRAQGLRIVNAKKSKYYEAALSNFEHAKARWSSKERSAR